MSGEQAPPDCSHGVAVIGAGITGLAAAVKLIETDPAVHVTVIDAAGQPGGILRTDTQDGFMAELGPDSFITNKPAAVRLCESIGFADQLLPTDATFRRSLVLHKGKPVPVPDGFMLMAPARPLSILTTPILSPLGKIRLLSEALVKARPEHQDDETLASFVRRRFGQETLDRLVQPLVGGIYTSDPEKLSLQATLPRFLDLERRHGSVIRGTLAQQRANRRSIDARGSGARYGLFTTPKDGLSSLVAALVTYLKDSGRVNFSMSTPIASIARVGEQWNLHCPAGQAADSPATLSFAGLICTLPAHRSAQLVDDIAPDLALQLQRIDYASSAVVVTGHRLEDFEHPLDAFGLVIPFRERRRVLAVSFTSRKFPGRAPAGCVLLRTFVGGAMQPEILERDDAGLRGIVQEELTQILGLKASPIFAKVQRYTNAMPQYHLGHLQRVEQIEAATARLPGFELAGNAYRGVGIPDSIASGEAAAARLLTADRPRAK